MRRYKCISQVEFNRGKYSLAPIRDEDKYEIMRWRNEQLEVLRQNTVLTSEQQDAYFKTIVDALFDQGQPRQLLFSFFENGKLIGYGGLVHIDWKSKIAEISFLTETARNSNTETFLNDWTNYLSLLKEMSNDFLNFNSIYTYAYDIRPHLFVALEKSDFKETKRIKNEVMIGELKKDVVIHTLKLNPLTMECATKTDALLYFQWANDVEVRKNSFQSEPIRYDDHIEWFSRKLVDPDCRFYLFKNEKSEATGQVRISKTDAEIIVGISIDSKHRGRGYGSKMLRMACQDYFDTKHVNEITAFIKEGNISSLIIFKRIGFVESEKIKVNGVKSLKLVLKNEKL